MTEDRFLNWLSEALPGESIIYHRGFLAYDIARERFSIAHPERVLFFLHSAIQAAIQAGSCTVTQRRLGKNDFEYIAIKREITHG